MKYEIHIESRDQLGFNMLENVVKMANLGATLKPDHMPIMRWPFACKMILESDTAPTPEPQIRIFEESGAEVRFVPKLAEPASFSMDSESVEVVPAVIHSKESLEKLSWDEFKEVVNKSGVTGRDRTKMTKQYLAKVVEQVGE